MRVFLSNGVKALNLPRHVVKQTAVAAKHSKPAGREGKFFYLPLAIVTPGGKAVDLVGMVYLKPKPSQGAKRGDAALYLRSEWDKRANPLD